MAGLVDRHHAEIFAFLARLLRNSSEAEDLVQETFLKAFRSCQQLREPAAARAWLYRIAWNTFLAFTRSARAKRLEALDSNGDYNDCKPSAEAEMLSKEQYQRLHRFVSRLPLQQRSAFLLRKYQGLEYAEIAESLNCSEVTARANVSQALRKIRRFCQSEGFWKG